MLTLEQYQRNFWGKCSHFCPRISAGRIFIAASRPREMTISDKTQAVRIRKRPTHATQ
jgi:hypothetical protein